MSDVDVVRRCLDAISERDVDTLAALSTDDVEVRPLRAILEDTVYRGREGVERWMRDLDEAWAELRIEVESVREVVPGSVVAFATLHNRGNESDVPTSMAVALTARLRDGLVTHAAVQPDREAALREASEQLD
jgi:ketosteroid isomerase-like protein